MGIFDSYCTLCGAPLNGTITTEDLPEDKYKKLPNIKWLENFYILFDDNNVSNSAKDNSDNMSNVVPLKYSGDNGLMLSYKYNKKTFENEFVGLCIHCDCYSFIKTKIGIKLKFSHFPFNICKKNNLKLFIINSAFYNPINKYQNQFFNYEKLIDDKNEYLITSPLKNIKKQHQILRIFNRYKIKVGRNSPLSSATWYKSGDVKIGEDGNFYYISKRKWIRIMNYKIETKKCKIYESHKNLSNCYLDLLNHKIGYVTKKFVVKEIIFNKNTAFATIYKF